MTFQLTITDNGGGRARVEANDDFSVNYFRRLPTSIRLRSTDNVYTIAKTSRIAQIIDHRFAGSYTADPACQLWIAAGLAERETRAAILDVLQPPEPNVVLRGELWNHQKRGYAWILSHRACMLYWGMGTGKSRAVMDVAMAEDVRTTLIVSQKKVIGEQSSNGFEGNGWGRQIDLFGDVDGMTFLPLGSGSVAKDAKQLREALDKLGRHSKKLIVAVNYDSIWRKPLSEVILSHEWGRVVLDESHRAKAAGSNVSEYLYRLGIKQRQIIALTGTPTPQGPLDIYGQYRALDPAIFGTDYDIFKNRYALFKERKTTAANGKKAKFEVLTKYVNVEDYRKRLWSICYHVPEDAVELPDRLPDTIINYRLDPDTKQQYLSMREASIAEADSGDLIEVGHAGARRQKLRQILNGFIYEKYEDELGRLQRRQHFVGSKAKQKEFEDWLQDMERGPLVVWHYYPEEARQIAESLRRSGWTVGHINSSHNDLTSWQRGGSDAIVCQLDCANEGIDLTRAHREAFYSLHDSLGKYEQCRKRIHRPGAVRSPQSFFFICRGSVEALMYQALKDRKDINEYVVHGLQNGLGFDLE